MTHYSRHTIRIIAALIAAVPLSAQTSAPRIESPIAGVALVANQESASATIADFTHTAGFNVHVGTGPHEAAISPDGKLGVLTIYGDKTPRNQLAILDLATRKLVRTIDLGNYKRPHGAIFLPGNSTLLAVTSEATQRVLLVDVVQGSIVADIPTENQLSHMMGITADGKHIYTANVRSGSISELDVANRTFTRQLPVATQTEGIAVRPDGAEVWVGSNDAGTVSVVDTRSWAVVAKIGGFGMPYRISISPNGKLAAICDPKDSSVHVVDVASRKLLGDITGLGAPNGVTIAPDNRTAFVTAPDTQEVVAVDLVSRTVRGRLPVQRSPDGVAYAPVTLPPAPAQSEESPVAASTSTSTAPGAAVLERMRSAYDGHWYHSLTFVQKTTVYRPDGTQQSSTWYESLRYTPEHGTQLRIDMGDPAIGNGVLYTADSSWRVRTGTPAAPRGDGNEFLPLIEGVYMQPVSRTVADLATMNVDLSLVHAGRWRDRPVTVVGAANAADTTSPQFWIDSVRNVVVRMVVKSAPQTTLDITLDGYVQVGGGWLATKVTMKVNGTPRQVEEYTGWKADVDLPAALFDVTTWTTAPHWAKP